MMKTVCALFTALIIIFSSSASQSKECVILLHGLARTYESLSTIAETLQDDGYAIVNYDYPSTDDVIENLAENAIADALTQCPENVAINFVSHSMGGILIRQYLSQNKISRLKRVVMLAPPNKGSEVVDRLKDWPGFSFINGPAGQQLGTEVSSLPNTLGPADFDLGIIAGSQSISIIMSQYLPNPDDGKVSVASTKLEGMTDHIVLHVTHTFMMYDDEVIRQTLFFLKQGKFDQIRSE